MAEKTFTDDEQEAIRARVREIMDTEGLTQAAVARDGGLAYGTFTGWLAGSYAGNNDKIAGQVQIWLTSREEKKRAATLVPKAPVYVPTKTSAAITDALRFAQIMPEISVVAGAAGIGKTTTARQYERTTPNVWMATMDPSTAGVNTMLTALAETMGVTERSPAKLAGAIGRRVTGTGGLVVIDEAQHLQTKALDMLRSIFDRYEVGIALLGNEAVYARLEGEARRAEFAQLYSRIGVRHTQSRPKAEDMCALIEAWGITDKEQVTTLKAIARKPGALRSMTKVLQMASMLAAGADEELAIDHIRAAYARLTPTKAAEAA